MSAANDNLDDGPTEDAFLGGKLMMLQARHGFRAGIDSVLLGACADVSKGSKVLDAGCGAGVAGLCLATRVFGTELTGIDKNAEAIALANRNAASNKFGNRARFLEADVFDAADAVGADQFDHVISNPPFHDAANERPSPDEGKATAHGFVDQASYREAMSKWIKGCLRTLKTKGGITLVNRIAALPAMLAALDGPTGAIEVVPLLPFDFVPAKRVIIRAKKGAKSPMVLHPGIALHQAEGGFTPQIEAALRNGAALNVTTA